MWNKANFGSELCATRTKSMSGERERNKVCDAFEIYLAGRPDLLERIAAGELSGKVLLCWCHPKRCHGDTLANLANNRRTDHDLD